MRRRSIIGAALAALLDHAAAAQPSPSGVVGAPFPLPGPDGYGGPGPGPLPGPSLDLNFINGSAIDSRISFSRASTASYFDNTGTLQSSAANTSRFDFNPVSLAARGLLIEEARTNGIRNPRAEGAVVGTPGTAPTNWTVSPTSGLTSSIVGVGSEAGIPYCDISFSGTATGFSFIQMDSATASAAQLWTHSSYVRLTAGSLANLVISAAIFFTGGTGNAAVSITPTSAAMAGQRTAVTATAGTGVTSVSEGLQLSSSGAVSCTLRVGGPQLELGAFATSLILPVVGTPAATARVADLVTMPTGSWFSAVAGTLAFEFDTAKTPSFAVIGGLTDGTFGNSIYIGGPGSANAVTASGVAPTSGTVTLGITNKQAASYSAGSLRISSNAAAVGSATLGAGPFAWVTSLVIGDSPWNPGNQLGGHMRRVRFWPRALSSGELQQVTT